MTLATLLILIGCLLNSLHTIGSLPTSIFTVQSDRSSDASEVFYDCLFGKVMGSKIQSNGPFEADETC